MVLPMQNLKIHSFRLLAQNHAFGKKLESGYIVHYDFFSYRRLSSLHEDKNETNSFI